MTDFCIFLFCLSFSHWFEVAEVEKGDVMHQSGFSNHGIKSDDSCGLVVYVARLLLIKAGQTTPTQS